MKKVMFYVALVILCFVCNPWPVEAKEVVEQQDIKTAATFENVYNNMKAEIEEDRDSYSYVYHEFSMADEYAYWRLEPKNWDNAEVHIKIYDGDVIGVILENGVEDTVRVLTYAEYMEMTEEG